MRVRSMLVLLPALLAASVDAGAEPPLETSQADEQPDVLELVIPLPQGTFDAGAALLAVCDAAALPADHGVRAFARDLEWTLDLTSPAGRDRLAGAASMLNAWAGDLATTELTKDALTIHVEPEALASLMQRAEPVLHRVARSGPGSRPPGLWITGAGGVRTAVADMAGVDEQLVILVHGLDSPAWTWDDMIAALHESSRTVAVFNYSGDEPISDVADALAMTLMDLEDRGTRHVSLVAHSAGGLVCRDVLTRRVYYDGNGAATERLPAVDRLIMLGTPNHGTNFARLRSAKNLLRQLAGTAAPDERAGGETAIDLLPGSDFLTRLNQRPLPAHTKITNVAGRIGPDTRRLAGLADRTRAASEAAAGESLARRLMSRAGSAVADALEEASTSTGDGVVAVESARLDGVDDFVLVESSHMAMIVDVTGMSDKVPMGVRIVLERLGAGH